MPIEYLLGWIAPAVVMVVGIVLVLIKTRAQRRRIYCIGVLLFPWGAMLLGELIRTVIGPSCDIRLKGGGSCIVFEIDLHEPILMLLFVGSLYAFYVSAPLILILAVWEIAARLVRRKSS